MKTVIGLIGPQGVGKETISRLLLRRYRDFHYVETGGIIRRKMSSDTKFRDEVSAQIKNGHLLSTEDIMALVSGEMVAGKESAGYILDGIPRTLDQAVRLAPMLSGDFGIRSISVFYFELMASRELSFRRMHQRVQKALDNGKTPREDDTPEALERRLAHYEQRISSIRIALKQTSIGYNQIDVSTYGEETSEGIAEYITSFLGNRSAIGAH